MSEFVIAGIDDWDKRYDRGVAVSTTVHVREALGVTYWLRLIDDTWVFCPAHPHEPDALYYLTNALPEEEWIEAPAFESALIAGEFGRFIVHRVRYTHRGLPLSDICHIWLSPDGTGRVLEYMTKFTFAWQMPPGVSDIRGLVGDVLVNVVQQVFDLYVNPILDDPYVYMEQDSARHADIEFICGSEAELIQVSTWILQSEPGLYDKPRRSVEGATLSYESYAPDGSPYVDQPYVGPTGPDVPSGFPRISRLAELAFEHNAFTGMYWEYLDMRAERRSSWEELPLSISVRSLRPTPIEMAEALANLRIWLEGKVPAAELDELLRREPIDRV